MSKLGLMRMELEGEISEIEAQLEAKRGALREVPNNDTRRVIPSVS